MERFAPGLEGVIAVETEIAEPDRDGGALRYRGIDIRDLVGTLSFEQVWTLLVDGLPGPSSLAAPAPVGRVRPTGDPLGDLQSAVAGLSGTVGLRKLIDMDAAEVRADLELVSAATVEIVAQLAGGSERALAHAPASRRLVERFVYEWRGEVDPRVARAIEAYWICTAEHGLNASTFTARIVASTGADCAACIAAAIGALSGPLHGGAPARVLPMLDDAEARGVDRAIRDTLDAGERLMGFGHRVYRAEDPRARLLRETARAIGAPRLEVAEAFESAALAELRRRKPDRVLATNVEYWSAVVLDAAGVPAELAPALFACSRTAGWSAHILEQHRTGRLIRPSARYVGPATATLAA